ncbi:MAG: hypothetical protein HC859_04870 [Bacteroidia bacterium]|nr:hypothetical protein [Bacteroidia bacterium]
MKTVTIDIINEKAMKLLQDLELLQLIRVRNESELPSHSHWSDRHKGAMTKQPISAIDEQLNELRNGWE